MTAVPVFQDLFLVWLVGLVGGLIAYFFKQPLLLGYMLGGLLVSPFTPGPAVRDLETIQHLAEFGVVLLMFSIGVEMAPMGLRRIGGRSLLIGVGKTLVLAGGIAVLGLRLGWPLGQSIVMGFALSIASTMVITKMLLERGELRSTHGQVLLGIAIVEDGMAMGLLLFLPLLADPTQWQPAAVVWTSVKVLLILAGIFALGVRIVPRILSFVTRLRNPELSVLVLLAIAMGIGVLSVWSGLSLALGAFVAGLVLSGSEATSRTMRRVLPMRDLFVVTFFVSLGVLLDPVVVAAQWRLLLGLLAVILIGQYGVGTLLALGAGYGWGVAWRVGLGLSQVGEFSIVLGTIARDQGLLAPELHHLLLALSLLSILVNTFIVNLLERVPTHRAAAPN